MKHPDPVSALAEQASALGVPLGEDQLRMLLAYESLLLERAAPLGLVAAADTPRIRKRRILGCLRSAAAVEPADRRALDLGSGAGLPGIVIAVAVLPWRSAWSSPVAREPPSSTWPLRPWSSAMPGYCPTGWRRSGTG